MGVAPAAARIPEHSHNPGASLSERARIEDAVSNAKSLFALTAQAAFPCPMLTRNSSSGREGHRRSVPNAVLDNSCGS
jgi:hypothetical protein